MMRRLLSCVPAGLLLIALAGLAGSLTYADPPAAVPAADTATPAAGSRKRAAAGADLRTSPQLGGRHRCLSRRSRTLAQPRRFQPPPAALRDPFQALAPVSGYEFSNVLLRLPHEQAVDLYDEVVERIQTNYVDPVPLEPLVRHGLDNLEVALRDPVFVKTNAPAAAPGTGRTGSARRFVSIAHSSTYRTGRPPFASPW